MSIRSVAQRVGVTPPSIYLHFADKDALLDAVCARYFHKLDLEMLRAAREHTSAVDALRAQSDVDALLLGEPGSARIAETHHKA